MKFNFINFKKDCDEAIKNARNDKPKSLVRSEYEKNELANKLEILLKKYNDIRGQ